MAMLTETHPPLELLDLIRSCNALSLQDPPLSANNLVAFKRKHQSSLSIEDLTLAFSRSFHTFHLHSMQSKVFVTDWLAELVKSSTLPQAPTAVIHELSKVMGQLSFDREQAESWMSLLISLEGLVDSCLAKTRKLPTPSLIRFLDDSSAMTLSTMILDTGIQIFNHLDRSRSNQERSEGFRTWKDRTFATTSSFQVFIGEEIQRSPELRDRASILTIQVCNMLLRFAEEARSEYKFLNLAFKCIDQLLPCCEDKSIQVERYRAFRLVCDGIHGTLVDIYHTCKEKEQISDDFFSRRLRIAQFYCHYLRSMAGPLFKRICQDGREDEECRGLLRYLLFFLRGRLLSDNVMRANHPNIHGELSKLVFIIEDIIPLAISKSRTAMEQSKLAVVHEFAVAAGPRVVFLSSAEPLSEQEWRLGRMYYLLKMMTIFEELGEVLQIELYPPVPTDSGTSLLRMLVDCVDGLIWENRLYPAVETNELDCNHLSLDILTDMSTFAHVLSLKQFNRLQLDMTELALGRSEFWSLLAREWWIGISVRLGPDFTRSRIMSLTELLSTLPVGSASLKLGNLLRDLISSLDESQRIIVTSEIIAFVKHLEERDSISVRPLSFFINFPFETLKSSRMDTLVEVFIGGWKNCCDLLVDEDFVLEAFYTMHQYVDPITSIAKSELWQSVISEEMRSRLVIWSVEIVGGVHDLLQLIESDEQSLSKVNCTIDSVVLFLTAMQPLQSSEALQVLNAVCSWPPEKNPLSGPVLAGFLESCLSADILDGDNQQMSSLLASLFTSLGEKESSASYLSGLMSAMLFCQRSAKYPQIKNTIPMEARPMVQRLLDIQSGSATTLDTRLSLEQGRKQMNDYRFRGFPDSTTVTELQALQSAS
ncbi:hypothetical protein EMPS_05453 [Entomortierella parvispora]|uniref:Uncharacterized protein n=1 Tax=Entomortierella parvispora TaxID=205924 RepID=A0A9P3HAF6_9FUNG|nr:hypothetical protein EMPS_05453 [Entomortierella parvispora]